MADPPLLSLRGARLGFGGAPLFADVDLQLFRGDRACLVGRNGSGKTTLLRVLAGELELDGGEQFIQPGLSVSLLPQDPAADAETTVAAHVAAGRQPRHEVDAVLAATGLEGGRRLGALSGGERRRADLARALAGAPDVLLLDEPTNHLDLAAIDWLERTLAAFPVAVLTVSHDRTFLVNLTRRMLWLDRGKLRQEAKGFAAFEDWSRAVLEAEEKEAARLDTRLAAETRWLLRGITARRRRNQGRLHKLEQLRAARAAVLRDRAKVKFQAIEGEVKSRLVIEAEGLRKSFAGPDGAERVIVDGFSTRILRGDRVGIIGPNGSGKTTLLRLLTGDLVPDAGRLRLAKALTPAYFDQNRAALDPEETLWGTLCPQGGDSVMVQGRQRHVVGYLKDFLFRPDQIKSPTGSLSGGERNRLLLARLLAMPSDLLVLDEPTNDLDMDTLDLLQELLADHPGTLLLVSHDRDFLDRTVSSTIAMEGDGRAREYPGGYRDYLAQLGPQARTRAEARSRPAKDPAKDRAATRPVSKPRARLGYKAQRELDLLPDRIAALEAEVAELEARLADPRLFKRDRAGFDAAAERLAAARAELAAAEERWLALEQSREALARETGS